MAKLVSVNVGLPREIEWQGKVVRTGIWKLPVAGRVQARRLNLDGDGQGDLAGHGGEHRAVMVYQTASYRYWQDVLKRSDLEYGQFGENFTVDGLADDEVCIGDRYAIGGALFEVTQPRVTCYRVGIRMKQPDMAALLVSHRRPGFYFRVLTEGEVGAGDEIRKIADGAGGITVAEADGLLYLPGHDPARLAVAVTVPALSAGWRHSFEDLLAAHAKGPHSGNAGLVSASPAPLWTGFRALQVQSVHRETNEITSVVFASADGDPLPAALPGQHLVLRLRTAEGAPAVVRNYSISNAADSGVYRISVKRDAGPGSRYVADRLRAGDTVETSAPRGDFVLRSGTGPVVLLSAGIGITPLLSMLHALAAAPAALRRKVWWIHAARSGRERAFLQESRKLLETLPGSRSVIVYSKPGEDDRVGTDFDVQGHLDLAQLQSLGLPADADVYLCGPIHFLADMERYLKSSGIPAEAIHQELFGPGDSVQPGVVEGEAKKPHPPSPPGGSGPLVSFARSGLSVPWDGRFKSLLEFAEACDVPVKWSCRSGVCHMCECGLLSGSLQYSPAPLEAPAAGNALICCSVPAYAVDLDL